MIYFEHQGMLIIKDGSGIVVQDKVKLKGINPLSYVRANTVNF